MTHLRRPVIAAAIAVWLTSGIGIHVFDARVQAFEWDAHYAWTYYLCVQLGLTPRQAYQIASATFSVDGDPRTGPMEASAGDIIIGARHPGYLGFGRSNERLAEIWTKFHAFRREGYTLQQHLDGIYPVIGEQLWALAVQQRNLGPYLHFTQDIFSHGAYDDIRGHATAGHAPDYMSFDRTATADMTRATVVAIERFMREVLHREPRPVNWPRVTRTMNALITANPVTMNASNWDPFSEDAGRPSLGRAISTINAALREETAQIRDEFNRRGGRIPAGYFDAPGNWMHFSFREDGIAAEVDKYAVERVRVGVANAGAYVDGRGLGAQVHGELSYVIDGLADLPMMPTLPVIETLTISSGGEQQFPQPRTRDNGDYTAIVEGRGAQLPARWKMTIEVFGMTAEERTGTLDGEGDARVQVLVRARRTATGSVEPYAGARVRIGDREGQTDAQGRVTLTASAAGSIPVYAAPRADDATHDGASGTVRPSTSAVGPDNGVEIELPFRTTPGSPVIPTPAPPTRPRRANLRLDRPAYIFHFGPPDRTSDTYFLRTTIPEKDSGGAFLFADGSGGVYHQRADFSGPYSDTESVCAVMRGLKTTILLYGNGPDFIECDRDGPSVAWTPNVHVPDVGSVGPSTVTGAGFTGPRTITSPGSTIEVGSGGHGTIADAPGGARVIHLERGFVTITHSAGAPPVSVVSEDGNVTTIDTRYRVEIVDLGTQVDVFEGSVKLTGRSIYRLALPNQDIGKMAPVTSLTLTAPGRALIERLTATPTGSPRPSYLPPNTGGSPRGGTAGGTATTGSYLPGGGAAGALPPVPRAPTTPASPLARPDPWNDAHVRALIDEWLRTARPLPAKSGENWRYSDWGVALSPGAVAAGAPDHPAGWDRFQTVWSVRTRLGSQNVCTLGEFVDRRLSGAGLSDCLARVAATAPAANPPPVATPAVRASLTGDWTCQIGDGRQQIAFTGLHIDAEARRVTATLSSVSNVSFSTAGQVTFRIDLAKKAPQPVIVPIAFRQDTGPTLSAIVFGAGRHDVALDLTGDRLTGTSTITNGRRLSVGCVRRDNRVEPD